MRRRLARSAVPGGLVLAPLRALYRELALDSARLSDPILVGPLAARGIRLVVVALESLAVSAAILAPLVQALSTRAGAILALLSLASLGLSQLAPRAWRSVLASGLEGELPAVLVYLIPYTASPRYLVDVIAGLPSGVFRWFQHEAARLRLILGLGRDPLTALQELAETTPSRRLREVLEEYTGLQLLGATSAQTSLRILDRAVGLVREKWRGYTEAARAVVELLAAGLVSVAALAPLAGGLPKGLAALAGLMIMLAVFMLLATRPRLGDTPRSPAGPILLGLGAALGAVLAAARGAVWGLLALAPPALLLEALALRAARREERALAALREAAERARLGMDPTGPLGEAQLLGPAIVAVVEATRIAGGIGVYGALQRLARVVEEARLLRRRAWLEGLVLEAVSAAAPAVLAVALGRIEGLLQSLPGGAAAHVPLGPVLGLAVLAPLPAAVLRRGYYAGLLGSIAGLLGAAVLSGSL